MNKVRAKFENLNRQQGEGFQNQGQRSAKKDNDSDVIEAEFRKL